MQMAQLAIVCLWLLSTGYALADQLVSVSTADELYAAISNIDPAVYPNVNINLLRPIQISSNWTTVEIRSKVTILSGWRTIIDFCDIACREGQATVNAPWFRVRETGELLFRRVFFRNAVPPQGRIAAYLWENGPSPFIQAAGGKVSYNLVPFYFRSSMLWAFEQPGSFWYGVKGTVANFGDSVATFSTDKQLVWYSKSFTLQNQTFNDVYFPVDAADCYDGLDDSVTLIYCPFTFRDSLLNPYASKVWIFHNIGWDRIVYRFSNPFPVYRSVQYLACPGRSFTIDMDQVSGGVVVNGSITFHNVTFAGSKVQDWPLQEWPNRIPMFLSGFKLFGSGSLYLENVTIQVDNLADVQAFVTHLPNCTTSADCSPDPSSPDIAPLGYQPLSDGFSIREWDLPKTRWLQNVNGNTATLIVDGTLWGFRDVQVVATPPGRACYNAATVQGLIVVNGEVKRVNTSADLLSALTLGSRYIEVTGDIELSPSDWSSPCDVTRVVEVRACTQAAFKLDFNNLVDIVRVRSQGMLLIHGNYQLLNLGWQASGLEGSNYIAAVQQDAGSLLEYEDVTFNGSLATPVSPKDTMAWFYSNIGLNASRSSDAYQNATVVDNAKLWVYTVTSNNTLGQVNMVTSQIVWVVQPSSQSSTWVLTVAIVVPVVAAGLAISVLVWMLAARRHRRRAAAAAGPPEKMTLEYKSYDDVSTQGSKSLRGTLKTMLPPFLSRTHSDPARTSNSLSKTNTGPSQDIEDARRSMVTSKAAQNEEHIVLQSVLGEGSYGKVYQGTWKGTIVAVKIMMLPSYLSGKERRERMLVMETAISSSLSHPNIVQTYTYSVDAMKGNGSGTESDGHSLSMHDSTLSVSRHEDLPEVYSWEVRLVQEFCDRGSLRDALNRKTFKDKGGAVDINMVLETALDVARAMAHLHSQHIVHSDLKARNVLLKSTVTDTRGFLAKVADFGLSLKIDPNDTHISNAFQGTITHMAPETLMYGHVSPASDVYAFGILLWELYSGEHAYSGIPKALLGHSITKENLRPKFGDSCPFGYQFLAYRCWEADPSIRPTFEQILEELKRIRAKIQGSLDAPGLVVPWSSNTGGVPATTAGPLPILSTDSAMQSPGETEKSIYMTETRTATEGGQLSWQVEMQESMSNGDSATERQPQPSTTAVEAPAAENAGPRAMNDVQHAARAAPAKIDTQSPTSGTTKFNTTSP